MHVSQKKIVDNGRTRSLDYQRDTDAHLDACVGRSYANVDTKPMTNTSVSKHVSFILAFVSFLFCCC